MIHHKVNGVWVDEPIEPTEPLQVGDYAIVIDETNHCLKKDAVCIVKKIQGSLIEVKSESLNRTQYLSRFQLKKETFTDIVRKILADGRLT